MKKIVLLVVVFIAFGLLSGCNSKDDQLKNNSNLSDINSKDIEEENNSESQTPEYEERSITLDEEDKRMLEGLICETCDFSIKPIIGDNEPGNITIPSNDQDKLSLLYMMLCDNLLGSVIDYKKYYASYTSGVLAFPIEDVNKILNDAFDSQISNPESISSIGSVKYNNGNIEFYMGNRGDESISADIISITQFSEEEVRIEGTVKCESGDTVYYLKNFKAVARINKDSIFGGYTLISLQEDNSSTASSEYILPDSDKKYLSESDVKNLSNDELELARNEIFARHGYIFKMEKFRNYFEEKTWYKEDSSFIGDDSQLNKYEKANVNLIKSYEENEKE